MIHDCWIRIFISGQNGFLSVGKTINSDASFKAESILDCNRVRLGAVHFCVSRLCCVTSDNCFSKLLLHFPHLVVGVVVGVPSL
jgi:hypothetical protein